jgi:hypothetical protein
MASALRTTAVGMLLLSRVQEAFAAATDPCGKKRVFAYSSHRERTSTY